MSEHQVQAAAALLAALPYPAWLASLADARVTAANRAAEALFGVAGGGLLGRDAAGLLLSPEDQAWWAAAAVGDVHPLHSDAELGLAGGVARHFSRSIAVVMQPAAAAAPPQPGSAAAPPQPAVAPAGTQVLVTLQDCSVERRTALQRDVLLAELRATLEATGDGILVTDTGGRITAFNRRFARLWALPELLLSADNETRVRAWMADAVADPAGWHQRLQSLRQQPLVPAHDRIDLRSGHTFERVSHPLVSEGRVLGRVWSFRDLSEGIAAEHRIETMALTDALTGLPNRRQLAERIAQAAQATRRDGGSFALLLIDLDRFRHVNDTLGHDNGDRVLLDVAQRIQQCLRGSDLLARLGADQFVVLADVAGAPAAEATARRVLSVVAQPCCIDGALFTLTCSIGIALAPSHGTGIDDLTRHAEAAMRAVKQAGRANFRLHQARSEGDRRWQMQIDHAMRQALVANRFRLHYQPIVSLVSGEIVAAEALLRWRDPELGEVSPGQFIPVAEESGLIVEIGDWVLSQAVRQAALWHQRGHAVPIAVNVSAMQFQQPHFVDRVATLVAVSGLPPALLELELTESILLHEAAEALERIHALQRIGVRLSIDDFGTGYSSLAYLKRLPVGKIKIDRSFVAGLPEAASDAGIVGAILQMARALGMKTVAEGVETQAQRTFLEAAGCDEFQGFLFAPALDSLSFETRLVQSDRKPSVPTPPRIRLVRG